MEENCIKHSFPSAPQIRSMIKREKQIIKMKNGSLLSFLCRLCDIMILMNEDIMNKFVVLGSETLYDLSIDWKNKPEKFLFINDKSLFGTDDSTVDLERFNIGLKRSDQFG
eukprot:Pgem_evm5s2154